MLVDDTLQCIHVMYSMHQFISQPIFMHMTIGYAKFHHYVSQLMCFFLSVTYGRFVICPGLLHQLAYSQVPLHVAA
jgi:hypothetical protein